MGQRMRKEVQVKLDSRGRLGGFYHNGQFWRVNSMMEEWRDTGEWWNGEAEKLFFRVTARPIRDEGAPVLCEIFFEPHDDRWILYLLHD